MQITLIHITPSNSDSPVNAGYLLKDDNGFVFSLKSFEIALMHIGIMVKSPEEARYLLENDDDIKNYLEKDPKAVIKLETYELKHTNSTTLIR